MSPALLADPVGAFWSRVPQGDGCWEWPGSIAPSGYGQVHRFGRTMSAHRYAYMVAVGPVGDGLDVCHQCDNHRCVRPSHLFAGTRTDNMRDARAKGRHVSITRPETIRRGPAHPRYGNPRGTLRGEASSHVLLTEDAVREIRRLAAVGWDAGFIAGAFGIGRSTVQAIKSRQNWAWLA